MASILLMSCSNSDVLFASDLPESTRKAIFKDISVELERAREQAEAEGVPFHSPDSEYVRGPHEKAMRRDIIERHSISERIYDSILLEGLREKWEGHSKIGQ